MGQIIHEAIVVTALRREDAVKARQLAIDLGLPATEIIDSLNHSDYTFLIGPDGGKERGELSDRGDRARQDWKDAIRADQPQTILNWVHISYGEKAASVDDDVFKDEPG